MFYIDGTEILASMDHMTMIWMLVDMIFDRRQTWADDINKTSNKTRFQKSEMLINSTLNKLIFIKLLFDVIESYSMKAIPK